MDNAFRIIQLSDCHVSADPGALYRGVNARLTFEQVVQAALSWRPDLFLVSGDLSEDYSEASYAYLAGVLAEAGVPVVTTPVGAEGIAAVYIAAEDPGAHVGFLRNLTGGDSVEIEGGYRVDCGGHDLLVMTPEAIHGALPDCGLEAASRPSFAGVALSSDKRESRVVPSKDAGGIFLEWRHAAGAASL